MHADKIGVFTPTRLEANIQADYIVTLHYFRYAKNFRFDGEKHDFWEMAYVDRGEVEVMAEGKTYKLSRGEAIFHKPNEFHNIWAQNQYANVVIVSFVSESADMSFFENKILRFNENHQSILAKILKSGELCMTGSLNDVHQTKLEISPAAPYGSLQIIKNYLELLLLTLIQAETAVSRNERLMIASRMDSDNEIAEAVKNILEEHIYDSISLDFVLEKVCFSKTYLTTLFRRCTGQSVMAYYMDRKINQAQKLISERELSFTQIADLLGFHSIHHFSSSFKKNTGMSPTEYKNSVRSLDVL